MVVGFQENELDKLDSVIKSDTHKDISLEMLNRNNLREGKYRAATLCLSDKRFILYFFIRWKNYQNQSGMARIIGLQ